MTQDMIGGRFLLTGEASSANGSAVSSMVSVLGQALRAATAAPRLFRFIERWTSENLRYLVEAVKCEHLTILQAMDTILR